MTWRRSCGSTSVEVVILTPVVMFLAVLTVDLGRDADTSTAAQLAADQAARAASMVSRSSMGTTARTAAHDVLEHHRGRCHDPAITVGVTQYEVTVDVRCTARHGVAHARSVEFIDRYRGGS